MPKPSCNPRGDNWKARIAATILLAASMVPRSAKSEGLLHLEVLLNGHPIGLIGAFWQDAKGELSAKREELEELHLKVPDRFRAKDDVRLDDLPGVSYRYEEAKQTVDIAVADDGRLPQFYNLRGAENRLPLTQSSTGAVLNYLLFGGESARNVVTNWQFQGISATLDGRFFSPYGVVSQTGILASNRQGQPISEHLRLDTTWTYKDPDTALSYRAGDMVSGGLAWTRPVRLGVFRCSVTLPSVRISLPSLCRVLLVRRRCPRRSTFM
jgi:outer membrane usher protein